MKSFEEKYELVKLAQARSYANYSKFHVGAVLFFKDGSHVLGCNVENASYGLCNCAERTAIFSAIAQGYNLKDVEEIMISANCNRPVSPCGACRQVMSELLPADCVVTLTNTQKEVVSYKVKDLLPYVFTEGDLND